MSPEIHYKDYPILLALIKEPMGTAEVITKEANALLKSQNGGSIKLNENTVARRLKKLDETGAIRGAKAYLNHERLGLQLYFFLIHLHEDEWELNAQTVIQFCDIHPYTSFRDRVFGGSLSGMMVYFMLPSDSEALGLLLQCFEILKERKVITNYTRYQVKGRYNNEANLEKFDMNTNQWEINYASIENTFKTKSDDPLGTEVTNESVLSKLDGFDMALIREMTRDSRRPQKQILEELMDPNHLVGAEYSEEFRDHFRATPQTISRRLKEIDNLGIFDGYQLSYAPEDFGMFNRVLYIADRNPKAENALIKVMKDGHLPFPARIGISSEKIVFWMNLPANVMPRLTKILMAQFTKLQFLLFGDDLLSYYFYHRNYDLSTKSWKVSKEWIIDAPFRELDAILGQGKENMGEMNNEPM